MERPTISQRDLLLASKWTSLFFTTYALSLSFLEAAALSAVARTYRDCTILADIEGYRSSLADSGAVEVGRRYDVVPIRVRGGIFHPKIGVLSDENGNVRAAVGSGNLTFGGWGYNCEILDVLVPGRDTTCFAELAQFIGFLNSPAARSRRLDAEHVPSLDRHIASCEKAARIPGAGASQFMHTLVQPLDVQLGTLASEFGGAVALTVVSPFFSAHHGVERLASALSCENISVAVTPVAPSIFDFNGAKKAGFPVLPVASDQFSDTRTLHAKLFDIECRKGRIIVSGSANATVAALAQNVEAVVVRIVDRDHSFGWRPSGTHAGRTTDDPEPSEASEPCAIARVDGNSVVGRILGHASPQGEWRGLLSSGVNRESVGLVVVEEGGGFRFDSPERMKPISQSTSIQVILERQGVEVRGWLILQDLLKAIQEKGPIAHSIARVLSGIDTSADMDAILEYIAIAPSELIDAAVRQGGGRSDRSTGLQADVVIPLDKLKPESAFDNPGTWAGGAPSRSFSNMVDALVREFAASLPDQRDDAADDEDEDDAGGPTARTGSDPNGQAPATRGERVRMASVQKAFSAMFGMLNAMPAGPARAPGLYLLFDMIVQILPRCDQGDELTQTYLKEWMKAAQGCHVTKDEFDALDRCVSAILTKYVMDDPAKASSSHRALQRWLGTEMDQAAVDSLQPNVEHLDVVRLAPAALQAGWTNAWRAVASSTTSWAVARAIQSSLRDRRLPSLPAGTSSDEANILKRVASGEVAQDRVVYMTEHRRGNEACPGCNLTLRRSQITRLNSLRIETCGNLRCRRVIVDVAL